MRGWMFAVVAAIAAAQVETVDPTLRAAVERFYATQEAEDVEGYLSLWASTAERPRVDQLKYIFGSGDDKFSQIEIVSVRARGAITVVRASVTRDRTSADRRPDGSPVVFHTSSVAALSYVREAGEWKLVREGTPTDALADAVIAAPGAAERERLLAEEPDLVGPLLVSAVSRQAAAAAQRGLYPDAQALYERALDLAIRIGDKKLQADALQNIGNAMYYQRNLAAAKPIYERFVSIERELGNDEGIATALAGLGTAQYSQFEYIDAFASFKEALAIQERLKDTRGTATTLISTGNVQFVEGDFNGAIADYRRSRALYHELGETPGEARALEGLGRSLAGQGDLAGALEAFNGVLDEGRSRKDPARQGAALFSIGDVHVRLGNLDVARGLFDESRAQFERLGDQPNAGHALQGMGRTDLLAGRFTAAEEVFGRSAAACSKANDVECVAHATVGVAFAQSLQQHHTQAITSYRKGIALFSTLKKREDAARAEIGLAQALTGSGDYAGALNIARHAESEGAALGVSDVVWRARLANARAQRRLSNVSAALTAANDAVNEIERLSQRALDGLGDQPSSDSTSAYALLAVLQAEANDPRAAFATAERRRVHSLRITLARNERDIARGMTGPERDAERQLAVEVVTFRAQLDHEKALPKPNAGRIERLQRQLQAAVDRRSAERGELFTRLPELRLWRGLEPAIGPDAVIKALEKTELGGTEAAVEFVIDDDDLLAIVLKGGSDGADCRAYLSPGPRQTLAERVAHAVDPSALRDLSLWREASAELMKSIPSGAWVAISEASKAVVIPDDILWRVPFEALPVDDGFLADRTTVLYAGSATALLQWPAASLERPADWHAHAVLALTAPEISATMRDRLQATAPGWAPRPDKDAAGEIERISSLFVEPPATVLAGPSATESAFRDRAGAVGIIHVAAPFRMNGSSPLFSSIVLTPENTAGDLVPEKDGILEAREVMNMALDAGIAVFTDGSSMSMRGAASAADVVSWAWRVAGVPLIILPRWSADEHASIVLSSIYLGASARGEAVHSALREAATKMRSAEETRAPYYWAVWQVVGR